MEKRFRTPKGWQESNDFVNGNGRHLRTGSLVVRKNPLSNIYLGPGMREFRPKFNESLSNLADLGHNVRFINWQGQGGSEPRMRDRFHRAAHGFDDDARDLVQFMSQPVPGDAPKIYIGHSMGALIGLLALARSPATFNAAELLTPLLGFHHPLASVLENILNKIPHCEKLLEHFYVQGGAWKRRDDPRSTFKPEDYSSDPVRMYLHDEWASSNPEFQTGDLTLGGFKEACRAIAFLKQPGVAEKIKGVPVHIYSAEHDKIVPCQPIFDMAARIPNAVITPIPAAEHELLMENDGIRDEIIQNIHNFIINSLHI